MGEAALLVVAGGGAVPALDAGVVEVGAATVVPKPEVVVGVTVGATGDFVDEVFEEAEEEEEEEEGEEP